MNMFCFVESSEAFNQLLGQGLSKFCRTIYQLSCTSTPQIKAVTRIRKQSKCNMGEPGLELIYGRSWVIVCTELTDNKI